MPFDEKRNFLYEHVIKPALDRHPSLFFEYIRGDESLTVGRISEEISVSINEADILIADITLNNPNVFYELGFAHAKSRKALLLLEQFKDEKIITSFDISDFRCYTYTFSKQGFEEICGKIKRVLTNIIQII